MYSNGSDLLMPHLIEHLHTNYGSFCAPLIWIIKVIDIKINKLHFFIFPLVLEDFSMIPYLVL